MRVEESDPSPKGIGFSSGSQFFVGLGVQGSAERDALTRNFLQIYT
jgi:hypothetical protein